LPPHPFLPLHPFFILNRSANMCQNLASSSPAARHHAPGHPAHNCACNQTGALQAGRQVPASHDLEYPEVNFPPAEFLREVGEANLRQLVLRHHTLLRQSEIGHLFAQDDQVFAERVEKIADFIVEACGGPTAYSAKEGDNVCIRTRHFPFTIDERARETWLTQLAQALAESALPEKWRQTYWTWMEAFSIRMINRRTTKAQAARLGYGAGVYY
jgi:hemoglobin